MANFYAENATFRDEVFDLKGRKDIGAMWMMLTSRAQDFSLNFSNIQTKGDEVTADWEATYRFRKTGRMVHNRIKASFIMKDGLILKHTDRFNFHRWSQMALGLPGTLLGWTPFLKNKVRQEAEKNLQLFLEENRL